MFEDAFPQHRKMIFKKKQSSVYFLAQFPLVQFGVFLRFKFSIIYYHAREQRKKTNYTKVKHPFCEPKDHNQ